MKEARKEGIPYDYLCAKDFPGCSDGKESACNAGDPDLNKTKFSDENQNIRSCL